MTIEELRAIWLASRNCDQHTDSDDDEAADETDDDEEFD